MTPVSVVIQRHEERDVVDPRNVVISRLDTSAASVPSPNLSRSLLQDTDSLNCSLSYDTPDLIKYQKYPRVDLRKLRLSDSMFVGSVESVEESQDSFTKRGEKENIAPPRDKSLAQTEIEDEIVREEARMREEVERKTELRKQECEAKIRQLEETCKEEMERVRQETEQMQRENERREERDLEEMVNQMHILQEQEKEQRHKDLIIQAKKEEQLAKEKHDRKKRMGEQMEKFAPLDNKMKTGIKNLISLWNTFDDKKVYSPDLNECINMLLKKCQKDLDEGRNKVLEGECDDTLLHRLRELDQLIAETTSKLEMDIQRISNDKKAEEEKAKQLKKQQEEDEAKKAAELAAQQQQQQQQQQIQGQQTQSVSQPPVPAVPAVAPAAAAAPGQLLDSVSPDNKTWHESIIKFKSDFIKDVVFTDAEKQFKFDLQRAVNTPLNSLSGVSSAHLQDKVDKLVQLLSGATVTVGERAVSVTQHKHARSFCLGLAAKKLAKQGEDVVSSDHKSAFPAATFALAIWAQFPEFGSLLLAYMFEMCPFLVPHHPQQTAAQTDKEHYLQLGYKYDGETIERQDKYLKRMSGLARLYAALSVSHLPKAAAVTVHPHPLARVWCWLGSVLQLTPHTDITASLILDMLEVAGSTMFARYGKQFGKLLQLIKDKYFVKLEAVKSEGGPTVRLEQFLATAIRGQSIREPDGLLKQGFL